MHLATGTTLLADRGFPSTALLAWFEGKPRWAVSYAPHWKRGLSFVHLGLKWLQQGAANTGQAPAGLETDPMAPAGALHPQP